MSEAKPVAEVAQTQVASPITPDRMLQIAVEQNADIDKLEKLMALQERWEANQAKKAFVTAMNAFKADPPKITKDKHVNFSTQKGVTDYHHATLGNVCQIIGKALSAVGISYRWDTNQNDAGSIRVTCVLTHEAGHSESVTLCGSPDQSGGKNSIQAVGSAVTYLQRYTLLAATGMATYDQDDDGAGSEPDLVNAKQVDALRKALNVTGLTEEQFLVKAGANSIEEIHATRYQAAMGFLERVAKIGERAELEPYPQEKFDENLPAWRDLVQAGKRSPEQILKMVSSKAELSEDQKDVILKLK
ncbi:MAG: single-stranded DNA-binding protein [Oceanospirillaceae bacterium]|nr:single-stranded DNA-binding protein [Oceanospirillaceae bacterium]